MKKFAMTLATTALTASTLIGCGSNTYQPKASDTELSAYAGKSKYPYDARPEMAPHIFAVVSSDSTIMIYNAGDESYMNFEIWVNKIFTLHVDKLDARSNIAISPNTLFNSNGSNMGGAPANSITSVQVYNRDKLWDVQGPILPH